MLRQDRRVQEPRRHDRLRLARRPGGRAALRPRRAAAAGRGRVRRANAARRSPRYRRLLADDASPDELAAGLREWGSGEARIVSAGCSTPTATSVAVRGRRAVDRSCRRLGGGRASPRRRSRSSCATTTASCSARVPRDRRARLGRAGGERELRFEVDRLPLAEGRFHLRVRARRTGERPPLHSLDDALRFFVFPTGAETGAVLLDGRWTMQEIGASAPIGRA